MCKIPTRLYREFQNMPIFKSKLRNMLHNKRNFIFLLLAGIFITNAITAELIGGKLIQIYGFTLSLGILPWPIVFVTTDLINEYFGQKEIGRAHV